MDLPETGPGSLPVVRAFIAATPNIGASEGRLESMARASRAGVAWEERVAAGDVLWEHGSPADTTFGVASGAVKIILPGEEPALLALVLPGEFAGYDYLLRDRRHFGRAVALTDATLIMGGELGLRAVVRDDPERLVAAMRHSAALLKLSRRRIAALTSGPVHVRLGRLLLILLDRVGQLTPRGTLLGLGLTRSDLASLIGCRRETVARVLSRWRRSKWVSDHAEGLLLLNRPALEVESLWRELS